MKTRFARLWGFARPIPDVLTFITPIFSDGDSNYFIQESISGMVIDFSRVFVGNESQEINFPIVVEIGDPEIFGFEVSPDHIQMGSGHALATDLLAYRHTLSDERLQTKKAITSFIERLEEFAFDNDLRFSQTFHICNQDLQWKGYPHLKENANESQQYKTVFDKVDLTGQGKKIKVIGVGGAGGNAIKGLIDKGLYNVEVITASSDAQFLLDSKAHNMIRIGTVGLGCGMNPELGRMLAEETSDQIENELRGADIVIVVAGFGGGTGTGATPVITRIAKELGALTIAIVTKPFSYEGTKCSNVADAGFEKLSSNVDSLIIIRNEKLEIIYEDDSMMEWLHHSDDLLNIAVTGIVEIIDTPGHINVDFNDVKTIIDKQGKAMIGTATSSSVDRARVAAEQAISSPLLDDVDLSGARGLLVNITASRGLKVKEIKDVLSVIRASAAADVAIAEGIAYDETMGDNLRVTVLATGLDDIKTNTLQVQTSFLRTGTDQ